MDHAPWGFLTDPNRYLFFTGKGGVGKTSLAAATAVELADEGKRVLLVSTDPASNVDEALGVALSLEPRDVPGVPGLQAMNIDPEVAASDYRERVLGPYRDVMPASSVRAVEEQLSGACTTEIASFDEFTVLLGDDERTRAWDHVIFDTAPTGHTLRLLQLPAAWSQFIDRNESGASCLGPTSGLKAQHERYAETVRVLADPERTTLILVARPDDAAVREAARTTRALHDLGIHNQQLVINGVLHAEPGTDLAAEAIARQQHDTLRELPAEIGELARTDVPLRPFNLVGLDSLRAFASGRALEPAGNEAGARSDAGFPSLDELIDDLERGGKGLIMTMGKGGVGKTTMAAAVASELARRGHDVLLTTTDPAAHVADLVDGEHDHLELSRIDPVAETEAYTQKALASQGGDLDEDGRALLEEDLRSPCTEEVAVFHAFSRTISQARDRFVVMDTAPTGHTLLLLDTTGSYHREMQKKIKGAKMTTPLMRLQDPAYTKVLIVSLPETTPISEAASLQADLDRAGIRPYAWILNRSLAATKSDHPVLKARAALELEQFDRVRDDLASRAVLVPWITQGPEEDGVDDPLIGQLVRPGGDAPPVRYAPT